MRDPDHYFPSQRPNERIIVFMRRHWTVFLAHVMFTVLLAVVFSVLIISLAYFFPELTHAATGRILQMLSVMFIMFLLLFLFIGWVDYYLDVFLVTTTRIVQIKQNALFNRSISELSLAEIQDVSTKIVGIIPTFLKYGTLLVQTAGAIELFQFLKLPHPEKISNIIIHLREQRNRHGEEALNKIYQNWIEIQGRSVPLDQVTELVRRQSEHDLLHTPAHNTQTTPPPYATPPVAGL